MTIKDKILFFLKEYGVSREDFYKKTELSASNFKGAALKSELGGDKIVKILTSYKELSPDWLLLDCGSMLRTPQSPEGVKPEPSPPVSPPSKPDESILYNMYKDEKAERKEKESEIKELNARLVTMSEEIGRLKAIVGEENDKETPEVLNKGAVEDASMKKRSLQPAHGIPFANAPSDGRHQ